MSYNSTEEQTRIERLVEKYTITEEQVKVNAEAEQKVYDELKKLATVKIINILEKIKNTEADVYFSNFIAEEHSVIEIVPSILVRVLEDLGWIAGELHTSSFEIDFQQIFTKNNEKPILWLGSWYDGKSVLQESEVDDDNE
jgi:hypothetical protein